MEIKVRWTDPNRRQRLAIMVTGEPHCAEALLAALKSRHLKADAAVMISNRRDLEPLARKAKLPFVFIPWMDRPSREETRPWKMLEPIRSRFRRSGAVHENSNARLLCGVIKTKSSTSILRCCPVFPGRNLIGRLTNTA